MKTFSFPTPACLALLALICAHGPGCSSHERLAIYGDTVEPLWLAEGEVPPDFSEADRAALARLERDRHPQRLLRRRTWASRLIKYRPLPGPLPLYAPFPDFGALLGQDYCPRYHVLPSQNAILILHADREPTLLPLDPSKPIVEPEPPEAVWQLFRLELERDAKQLHEAWKRLQRPPAPPPLPRIEP